MPRNTSIQVAANHRYGRNGDRRMSASTSASDRPMAKPPAVKMRVWSAARVTTSGNCSQKTSPSRKARWMRPQSAMTTTHARKASVAP
jgi:hypothetical protein